MKERTKGRRKEVWTKRKEKKKSGKLLGPFCGTFTVGYFPVVPSRQAATPVTSPQGGMEDN